MLTILLATDSLSTGQAVGGGGILLVIGTIIGLLFKYLPVLNEEHKKYKGNVIDGWKDFAERQGKEIESLNLKLIEQEVRFAARMTVQEGRYASCQDETAKLRAEVESLKKEVVRLEAVTTNRLPPIILLSAEIVYSETGEIQAASEGVYPMLGWIPSELVQEDIAVVISPEYRHTFFEVVKGLVLPENGKEVTCGMDATVLHRNNRERIKSYLVITKGKKHNMEHILVSIIPRKDFFNQ